MNTLSSTLFDKRLLTPRPMYVSSWNGVGSYLIKPDVPNCDAFILLDLKVRPFCKPFGLKGGVFLMIPAKKITVRCDLAEIVSAFKNVY